MYAKTIDLTVKGCDTNTYQLPFNNFTLQEMANLIIYYAYELKLEIKSIKYGTIKQIWDWEYPKEIEQLKMNI